MILYVLLSLPQVQRDIAKIAEIELSGLLGTEVTLGEVSFAPFNRIVLGDVEVRDPTGEEALHIGHLGAGISLWESIVTRRPLISYVELIDLDLNLYRDSAQARLNIEPIIDRFKSKEDKGPSTFDLAINQIVIRRSTITYDVLDAISADSGRFDKNHIFISNLRADINAPRISDGAISVDVKRLSAEERSGLSLGNFSVSVYGDKDRMTVNNFNLEVGESRLALNDITLISPLGADFKIENALTSSVQTLPDSYITLSDLSPFVKTLEGIDERVDVDFELYGSLDSMTIEHFVVEMAERNTRVSAHGFVSDLTRGRDSLAIDLRRVNVVANTDGILSFIKSRPEIVSTTQYAELEPLGALGEVNILGDLTLTPRNLDFNGSLITDCGNLDIDCGLFKPAAYSSLRIDGKIESTAFNPSLLIPELQSLTHTAFKAEGDISIGEDKRINGTTSMSVNELVWNGYPLDDITASIKFFGDKAEASFTSSSQYLDFTASGGVDFYGERPLNEFYAEIRKFSFAPFVTKGNMGSYNVACNIDVSIEGRDPDTAEGWVKIENILFEGSDGRTLKIPYAELEASGETEHRLITLRSPQADADISGCYSLKTIGNDIRHIVSSVYPALIPSAGDSISPLDVTLGLTVKEDSALSKFFKLPVDFIYPATVNSYVKGGENPTLGLTIDMPFLRNKDKLIEDSHLSLLVDGMTDNMELIARTAIPTKDGKMNLDLLATGHRDSIATDVKWVVDRKKEFRGELKLDAGFTRDDENGELITDIQIEKSKIVFNDSMWTVNPANIHIAPQRIEIDNLYGSRKGQSLLISGVASPDSIDNMVVRLENIDLDYIFETLNLSDAVQFGGRANGEFYGRSLLSASPEFYTPLLKVTDMKYNRCVMGDGSIRSRWDNAEKSILIDAIISQKTGEQTFIDGYIKPMTEELDFRFRADKAPVGFMKPFMSAFTSRVTGTVSGDAHLYGNFKNIDMTGDIYVDNLGLKLDFTNTTYTTSDSIHIRPGDISFKDIELRDRYGKTAKLSGFVKHNYFHDASFRFDITDADNLLVYDVRENQTEDPWFGRIFGDGKVRVTGVPGQVDIDINMRAVGKSNFTFVISDAEQAVEYKFLTLRDRDKALKDSLAAHDTRQIILNKMKQRIRQDEEGSMSVYNMDLDIDVSPSVAVNILMDPVGGDKITAYGSGNFRLKYSSVGDMTINGAYTINRGKYNFTLQDIIVKDFDIREGSKISFLGDPYAAKLNLLAAYTVNANLSDLDESFLEDRELNRTNVKVDALLNVTGDIRQPDIKYDIDLPNLSEDVNRKVNSLLSTEEMKARQIIYLLAFNKFSTPEYTTGTHGNELVSVASSTISSRLGSMLGQLSDNWSIAPAIRSDRGDFSDVEVDVALSSHLLNNRLLFNGNLGYRDKSLNNNSFIGDFDIRYLLNRAGTIQLKAYNRYNDQNYYLKSALTTQGVGLVFKREFDNILSFLRRKSDKDKDEKTGDKKSDEKKQSEDKSNVNDEGVLEKRNRISTDSLFDK